MINTKPNGPQHLRADAEGRLRSGTAPPTAGWTVGADALSLLYRLASDPERSGDAQKLLHELQTHQVELDLQHAQLSENEGDLSARLAHLECLFDHAPAGYLVLGLGGRIVQSNRMASEVFGLATDQLRDHMLSSFLSPDSGPAIQGALDNAGPGNATGVVRVQLLNSRLIGLLATMAPGSDALLVMVFPENPAQ
jgi:PAS domain-containing protein